MTVANTSQHLQLLRQAGLMSAARRAFTVFYKLAGDDVVRLLGRSGGGRDTPGRCGKAGAAYLARKDDLEPVPARSCLIVPARPW